jgi:hypothetical protein
MSSWLAPLSGYMAKRTTSGSTPPPDAAADSAASTDLDKYSGGIVKDALQKQPDDAGAGAESVPVSVSVPVAVDAAAAASPSDADASLVYASSSESTKQQGQGTGQQGKAPASKPYTSWLFPAPSPSAADTMASLGARPAVAVAAPAAAAAATAAAGTNPNAGTHTGTASASVSVPVPVPASSSSRLMWLYSAATTTVTAITAPSPPSDAAITAKISALPDTDKDTDSEKDNVAPLQAFTSEGGAGKGPGAKYFSLVECSELAAGERPPVCCRCRLPLTEYIVVAEDGLQWHAQCFATAMCPEEDDHAGPGEGPGGGGAGGAGEGVSLAGDAGEISVLPSPPRPATSMQSLSYSHSFDASQEADDAAVALGKVALDEEVEDEGAQTSFPMTFPMEGGEDEVWSLEDAISWAVTTEAVRDSGMLCQPPEPSAGRGGREPSPGAGAGAGAEDDTELPAAAEHMYMRIQDPAGLAPGCGSDGGGDSDGEKEGGGDRSRGGSEADRGESLGALVRELYSLGEFEHDYFSSGGAGAGERAGDHWASRVGNAVDRTLAAFPAALFCSEDKHSGGGALCPVTCVSHASIVMHCIRLKFGITMQEYATSFLKGEIEGGDKGEGKSGKNMWFTKDRRFVIKAISNQEYKFFLRIFASYYNHIISNGSHTLLCRIMGLYTIAMKGGHATRIIVMNNVFYHPPTPMASAAYVLMDEVFDLKGSAINRCVAKEDMDAGVSVLKDLNFCANHNGTDTRGRPVLAPCDGSGACRKLPLDAAFSAMLRADIDNDCAWLAETGIMDYSLLVGTGHLEFSADTTLTAQPNQPLPSPPPGPGAEPGALLKRRHSSRRRVLNLGVDGAGGSAPPSPGGQLHSPSPRPLSMGGGGGPAFCRPNSLHSSFQNIVQSVPWHSVWQEHWVSTYMLHRRISHSFLDSIVIVI